LLASLGNFAQAIREAELARELDPRYRAETSSSGPH
jgi:hypothetical protein